MTALSTISHPLSTLLNRIQRYLTLFPSTTSTRKMHTYFSAILSFLLSWRTLFFLLALANLKSLPLSWHVRLFSGMGRYGTRVSQVRKRLRSAAASLPPPSSISAEHPKPVHPLFRPVATHTHAPMAECDYNIHKSNSTYFSDLDLSRGRLVASLIGPALRLNALVPHGIRKGMLYPILGSVHTSFLREIKPYEAYDVRSRVLGWDRKWILIGSWFVRKATPQELKKDKQSGKNFLKGPVGKEEVVFACVLNKYVIKAGRVTVPPELCFAGSGWFPVRPEATATIRAYAAAAGAAEKGTGAPNRSKKSTFPPSMTDSATATGTATPTGGLGSHVSAAANAMQNVALETSRRLSRSGDNRPKLFTQADQSAMDDDEQQHDEDEMPGWSWAEIEEERARGMEIAEQWLNLDTELRREYEQDMLREIW